MQPIAVTAGEPAGIGPDLVLYLADKEWRQPIVLIADIELLRSRAQTLGLNVSLQVWNGEEIDAASNGTLYVKHVDLNAPCIAGQLNPDNAAYVLATLDEAINGCLDGRYSAMVTAPVHKGVICDSGIDFSGHTEYLQEKCGVDKVVMMLANTTMKVALASTHLPLKDVADSITHESLSRIFEILILDLQQKFGIATPRILVCGLNPHAGEGGHMGREEIDVIEPVMASLQALNAKFVGPLPADTLFTPKYLDHADAVLAMYHDQGLPVLKYAGFGKSVNITLGLPIIRTSVDHGTALDLAGRGQANAGSLFEAVEMAIQMSQSAAAC